ncbi:hypothetical protein ARMGADRAFT_907344, partial [Armillaria gallica]
DRILDDKGKFKQHIIDWLEGCHTGDFFADSQEDVWMNVNESEKQGDYIDPTSMLPMSPPPSCSGSHSDCPKCNDIKSWEDSYKSTVDDLLVRSNIHDCEKYKKRDGSYSKKKTYTGCKDNKYKKCKARFPRKLYESTKIDEETGSLNMKKREPWINTITPELTYIMRCNTDVTNLSSGTAIKAVVLYISNYITKTSLRTHVVFEVIRDIFAKSVDIVESHLPEKEKARRLMGKIVNLLAVKLELGAPMLSMYLLGHPDHYTDHQFVPFYWKSFVHKAQQYWSQEDDHEDHDKVLLVRQRGELKGYSPVMDYTHRSESLNEMNLYTWAHQCKRVALAKRKSSVLTDNAKSDNDLDDDDVGDVKQSPCMLKHKPKNGHAFMDNHPFKLTHFLRVNQYNENVIPNFIGGILPRRDSGDREYYCSAMLALFKPWRNGSDLKTKSESWHEAFSRHNFSAREMQLMDNFNLRYECLDERDDF